MYHRLQYISQGINAEEQLHNIRLALEGGCRWIQLRMKSIPPAEMIPLARRVKELCRSHQATFIVNDHLNIAVDSGSDGVHLGLQDAKIALDIGQLGESRILGGSANTYEDCLFQAKAGCNYIGLGPFRYTTTKEKISPVLGIEGIRNIVRRLKEAQCVIPIYAIGGIVPADTEELMEAGVYGVAVAGAITEAKDRKAIICLFNDKMYGKLLSNIN